MRKTFRNLGKFLQTPVGVIIGINLVWHIALWALGINYNIYVSAFVALADIAFAFLLRSGLVYFFSQFILPIQNPNHRREIYERVNSFDAGARDHAQFVKNGRSIPSKREDKESEESHHPGLIVVDSASAIATSRVKNEIANHDAAAEVAGPGIKFTSHREKLVEEFDLRWQWQVINEEQTKCQTSDGVGVSARITVKFGIKRLDENNFSESGVVSPYGYNADAVRRAVVSGKADQTKWDKLPAILVANIWRSQIEQLCLQDIFSAKSESGLQLVEKTINERVKKQGNAEFGRLQARGIVVAEAQIQDVRFEDEEETEKLIVGLWDSEWMKNAAKEENELSKLKTKKHDNARHEAVKEFAALACARFNDKTSFPQDKFKTLRLLIEPLKDFALAKGDVSKNAIQETDKRLQDLDEIWKWLLVNDKTSRSRDGK